MANRRWVDRPGFYFVLGILLSLLVVLWLFSDHRSGTPAMELVVLSAFACLFVGMVGYYSDRKAAWHRLVRTSENLMVFAGATRGEKEIVSLMGDLLRESPTGLFFYEDFHQKEFRTVLMLVEAGYLAPGQGRVGFQFTERAWALVDNAHPMPLRWLIPGLSRSASV